jgi:hypothetical protein
VAGPSAASPPKERASHAILQRTALANFTGCDGEQVGFFVPLELLQDDVPPGYSPISYLGPNVAEVILRLDSCTTSAFAGKDAGPASWFVSFLPVQVAGQTPNQTTGNFYFVLEARANNSAAVGWFQSHTMNGAPMQSNMTRAITGPYAESASTNVANGSAPLYDWQGVLQSPNLQVGEKSRFFYGPNPKTDFLDSTQSYVRGSDGPADANLAASSNLSKRLGGLTHLEGTISQRQLSTASYRGVDA